MSYILEALKKSQADRELGQVPRVEGFGIDVPVEQTRSRPWAYLVLLLALLVAGAIAFVLLRGWVGAAGVSAPTGQALSLPVPQRADAGGVAAAVPDMPASMSPGAPAAPADAAPAHAPVADASRPADLAPSVGSAGASPAAAASGAPDTASPRAQAPVAAVEAAPGVRSRLAEAPPAAPLGLEDPDNLSVEPEVLVVPAPAAPGEPLPRGADELRRAVLGDGERVSASVDGAADLPSPPPPEVPMPSNPPSSDQVPVPEDLLAEIEAFKELVRKQDPSVTRRAAAAPPPLPEPPGLELRPATDDAVALPQTPSLDLRNRLPPFSMSVHVYNADPKRRFVYINGRKLTEQQQSREGLLLERIVADGAVLSFEGERFFQRR
jgi:general secretion pathway protein B